MMLGVENQGRVIFEGESFSGSGLHPPPMLSFASPLLAVRDLENLPQSTDIAAANFLFREDSFDPVTRVRRGRFYKYYGSRFVDWYVHSHSMFSAHSSAEKKRLITFATDVELNQRIRSDAALIALGLRDAYTLWRVVSVERIVTGEDLVTLRARSSLGILPTLDESKVPTEQLSKVQETLDKLAEAAHRAGPESIVDRAKDSAQWALGTWLAAQRDAPDLRKKDLARLAAELDGEATTVTQGISKALARLHARGKPNVQEERGSRDVTEDDAEFALATVGLLLREIGWAV